MKWLAEQDGHVFHEYNEQDYSILCRQNQYNFIPY